MLIGLLTEPLYIYGGPSLTIAYGKVLIKSAMWSIIESKIIIYLKYKETI